MKALEKIKWGFIGCGEVTEKKSGPLTSNLLKRVIILLSGVLLLRQQMSSSSARMVCGTNRRLRREPLLRQIQNMTLLMLEAVI